MKKYIFTLIALSMIFTATARKPKNTRTTEAAAREIAAADSLRLVASRQAALIDSLQNLVAVAEQRDETAESETAAPDPVVDPEQAAADSVAALRLRLRPTKIESIFDTNGLTVLDTLATENDAVQVILYSNNSWKYVLNREVAKDSTIFEKYWDTTTLFPYKEVDMSEMPKSVVIDLVDSLTSYHCPYQGSVHPRGKYGPRRRRQHQGVDLPLKTGDPVYATFCGRVRISQYNRGGYGNLVIIRHDNGLETYYGHLSERLVEPDQWVEAGQIIGLGGSTGRSTGPHLHFETRYYGQSFDPERLIDFKNGTLSRETFLLKKSFFSIQRRTGFRRRDRQRGAGQEGSRRESGHEILQDPFGRHAGRHRPALRNDRDEHLPPERHQIDHRAAHRTLAAGAIGQLPMRNRRTFSQGPAVFLFGRKRRRFVPQPPKNDSRPRAQNRITSVPKPLSAPKTRLLGGRAQNRIKASRSHRPPLKPAF